MRNPSEITHNGRALDDIIADHLAWLRRRGGQRANLARANLVRANLADANLAGALLADANLARANLVRANLADAYLAGANLADAYLAGANLARANLADANLADAYLAGANLADAYLARANLVRANLADANLADAYLAGCLGDMREIRTAQFDTWACAWTTAPDGTVTLQIGCQSHPLELWIKSDPRWIAALDSRATEWWNTFRDPLLALVQAAPATPYGAPPVSDQEAV